MSEKLKLHVGSTGWGRSVEYYVISQYFDKRKDAEASLRRHKKDVAALTAERDKLRAVAEAAKDVLGYCYLTNVPMHSGDYESVLADALRAAGMLEG